MTKVRYRKQKNVPGNLGIVRRAKRVMDFYGKVVECDDTNTNLSDLVADLVHWAKTYGIDWETCFRQGIGYAEHELTVDEEA